MNYTWPTILLGEVLTERQETPTQDAIASGEARIVAKIGFNDGEIQLRSDGETRTNMILIRPGDLVLSGINATKGAIAVYGRENENPIAATIHYGAYEVNVERGDIRYLWWLLRSQIFRDILLKSVPGGIKTELKAKRLLPIPVPLPPLHEQQRIVAKIEALAAKISQVKLMRTLSNQDVEDLSKCKLHSIYKSVVKEYGEKSLAELIVDAGYGTSTKCHYDRHEGEIPVLRIPNVISERISLDNIKYGAIDTKELNRIILEEGDLLIVRTNGSADLVGRCAVVTNLVESTAFASYLIKLRCQREIILPDFLQRMLKYHRNSGQLFDLARTTAGQYNVSLGRLRAAKIPTPPIDEQRRIVSYLDRLQAQVNALKKLQAQTAAELDALLPAILDRAFKGEL